MWWPRSPSTTAPATTAMRRPSCRLCSHSAGGCWRPTSSHSAVSRQVRSLERLTGVRLTHGPRNNLKLTDAGDRLAKSLGVTFDELERSFLEVTGAGEREIHVSCVGTLAMKWLIPRLAHFHARHPEISVRVTEAYRPVDFAREPFDAA